MNLRRFDTLALRLFLLMWATLVAAHLVAYAFSVPLTTPAGGPTPLQRLDPSRLPVLPSLPPTGDPGSPPPGAPPGPAPGAMPGPASGAPPGPPPGAPDAGAAGAPPGPAGPRPMAPFLWLDYALRAAVIALGAALGARWLARPMRRLAAAAQALQRGLARGGALPALDERRGTAEVRESARLFNRMAQRLREQFDARGLHLAAVSHDLRTPLTRLRMRLEALPPAEREAAARDIHAIDALLDDTLAVLREQRAGAPPDRLDLGALLQALVDDLAEQGQAVDLAAPPALPVRARPVALRRVLDNLVGNALRHGGNARLAAHRTEGTVEVWVDDDGPGIPPEDLARAFEPWVRLGAHGPGQGLGLAIARDLAEREGATLALANRPGGGLRASLSLPTA